MAYTLQKKVVKDTDSEFDNHAYGLTYPVRSGSTMFESTYNLVDAASANIRNLLLTRKGERIMLPEFGTGLHELLFEPMDDEFESKVQKTVIDSVKFWLPYVTIEEIDIDMSPEMKDRHRANLKLTFRVGDSLDLNQVTFTVQE
jgi:phage baseplate assembly protein W